MTNTAENREMTESSGSDADVLVVISKLKNYIRAQSGFNTAGTVAPAISNMVRMLCDRAVENAKKDGRKTVMDRDFTSLS
jgi:histone H3/H4